MPRSRKKPVTRYHDRVAGKYDQIYQDLYWQWHDQLTWDYLKPHLPVNQSAAVIDLGCGTGKWGLRVAESGFHVTCLDISHKMLDGVQRKIADTPLAARVDCVEADLMDLGALPSEHYGLATAFGEPLCSTEKPAKALKEIWRILAPGGLFVATIDNRLNACEYYLDTRNLEGLERLIKSGRTHWLTRDHEERFELHTFTPHQVRQLLENARFEVIEMVGKTVLPMRRYRQLLEDRTHYRKLLALEKRLARDPDGPGRAPHIQIVARKSNQ